MKRSSATVASATGMQQPQPKKKQKPARVIKMLDFNIGRDAKFMPATDYNGLQTVKLLNRHTNGALMISFTRGGWLSQQYGVAVNIFGKINVTFDVADDEEVQALEKMHKDIVNAAFEHTKEWFGSSMTLEEVHTSIYNTFTPPKKRRDSDDCWNASFRCTVANESDLIPDRAGQRIVNVVCAQENVENVYDIVGRKYDKAIVELKSIFFSVKDSQCRFGISKELRAMRILPILSRDQVELDDDDDDDEEVQEVPQNEAFQ
jgi:hypothetical protein